MVYALSAQTQNVSFLKTKFSVSLVLIIQKPAIVNCFLRNSLFNS
jgi:hypothetical protein